MLQLRTKENNERAESAKFIKKRIKVYKLVDDELKNEYQYLVAEKLVEQQNTMCDDTLEIRWAVFKGIICEAAEEACGMHV